MSDFHYSRDIIKQGIREIHIGYYVFKEFGFNFQAFMAPSKGRAIVRGYYDRSPTLSDAVIGNDLHTQAFQAFKITPGSL